VWGFGDKGGRYIRLTVLLHSCANCLEIVLALRVTQLSPHSRLFFQLFLAQIFKEFANFHKNLTSISKPTWGVVTAVHTHRQSDSVLNPQAAYLRSILILPSHLLLRHLQFLFLSVSPTLLETFKTTPHINALFFQVLCLPGFPT